ncbi:hypothetical protein B0H15DRAFT_856857 [Mycena belliarum]|uniref:NAD(P)-binding protein n=1 Tax=Mycena belliarum TaxID=1033014 RepID=A0AAD6TUZ4_9AGAR|nr:hypothetical protein B0H15DRAFT_856857 [Mycena belliae]
MSLQPPASSHGVPTTTTPTTATTNTTRVALVTGAAHGIGRAIALRLAADGLDVALNDLPVHLPALAALVAEIEAAGTGTGAGESAGTGKGRRAVTVAGDVTQEAEVRAMVEEAVGKLGRLDVMVANAGIADGGTTVMDADIAKCEKCWAVNIRGVVLCYKYAARQMVAQGEGGRIIGASSVCGQRGFAGLGAYCISKAAVRSLTQTAALELREHGITVNAYAPGVIDTAMTRAPATAEHDRTHGAGSGLKQLLKLPDVRTGEPADVAALVAFLASRDAHFMTGQTVSVDDGIHFS